MITVDCPQCSAQFRVPPHAVPREGRKLKCSSCGHTWHFIDPLLSSTPEHSPETDPITSEDSSSPSQNASSPADAPSFLQHSTHPDDSFSSILQKTSGQTLSAPLSIQVSFLKRATYAGAGYVSAACVAALMIWGLGNSQLVITTLAPRAQAAYDMVGMKMILGIPDFTFEHVKTKHDAATFTITGAIKNQSSTQKTIWPIRAALYAVHQSEPITIWVFRPASSYLNPGQEIPFDVTRDFTNGANIDHLNLSIMVDAPMQKSE